MRHDGPVAMDPEPYILVAVATVKPDAAHRCLAFAAPNPDEFPASVLTKRAIPIWRRGLAKRSVVLPGHDLRP